MFLAVVAVAVLMPAAIWNPPTTLVAHPYTAEELYGRTLFYSNGCNYCHTQYVRDVDTGMGPVSQGGDYNYDDPMILGSERTGPDLSYVGRKRNMQWEIDHLKAPRDYSPMSLMPDYNFLSASQLQAVATYLFYLGDRNAAEFMITPPAPYQFASGPITVRALQATAASAPPQGGSTFKEAGLYDGKLTYVSRCITCHGCAGNGLGTYGGTLVVTPANFKADPFKDMPHDQWLWHVSEGVQGTVMPPWKQQLTVKQRWDVIHYIQTVYAHPFERDPDEGDPPFAYQLKDPLTVAISNVDAGKRTWTRECSVCHGDAGTGMGIYRQGIEPVPPDFNDPAGYDGYTDADYYWRISEGVPWTAMPTWKEVFSSTERWQLVMYIRTMFTQTVPAPSQPSAENSYVVDAVMKTQAIPKAIDYDTGRQQFLKQCADCHGLAGDGNGSEGAYLNPKPANLTTALASSVSNISDHYDGVTFGKITNGINDTAMPIWGEFLNADMRWADVKFLKYSFTTGLPASANQSHYGKGDVPIEYVRTDAGIFQDEISAIKPASGKPIFEKYCSTCHGAEGHGHGPGTTRLTGGGPAAFAPNMNTAYVFSAIRGGIPDSMMYGFLPVLTETQIWNVTAYTLELDGQNWGG